MKRLALVLLFSTLVLPLAIACTPGRPPGPGMITDDLGRTVTIAETPGRVVSLAPSITEILFALGLGDRVVGVTDYSDYPEEALAKPRVGGYWQPSLEKIVALTPDLLLMTERPDLISEFENLGLTFVVLDPDDMDGILKNIELIGQITGVEQRAEALTADMEARIEAVVAKTGEAPKPRVFYVIDASDPSKPWTAGGGTFIDALIGLAGGENIAATAGQWTQFSLEAVVNADPEIIIADAGMGTALAPDLERLSGWKEIGAVKEGKVYLIDGALTSRPGPRIVDGLEEMARIIHPELFQ
ncbi:MAG: ABC transporter substrate-binding protein [Dehalococcoidia bacterium]